MITKIETCCRLNQTFHRARKTAWALAAMALIQLPALAALNDNFENATLLPANWTVAHGDNTNATAQAGEQSHSPTEAAGTKSVWWKWVPNFSGQVKITTEGSGSSDVFGAADPYNDTQLAVYTGATLGTLTAIAKNEDHGDFAHGWSRVNITVTSGTTYYIAVDSWEGFNGRQGRIQLNLGSLAGASRFFLTAAVVPPGAGTVALNPPQPGDGYLEGTLVNVTATPLGTNVFWGWGGASDAGTAATTVTMNGHKKALAAFNVNHGIFLQNVNTRQLVIWAMNNTNFVGSLLLRHSAPQAPGWVVFGTADMNEDGFTDLLMQHTDGRVAVRFMRKSQWLAGMLLRSGKAMGVYRAFAVADIDGNGHEDVLFSNGTDLRAWRMSGASFLSGGLIAGGLSPGAGWRPAAAGDINGNGTTDILFQHTDGRVRAWLMSGTTRTADVTLNSGVAASSGWTLFSAADLNSNNTTDLVFQHSGGAFGMWFMSGTNVLNSAFLRNGKGPNPAWQGKAAK